MNTSEQFLSTHISVIYNSQDFHNSGKLQEKYCQKLSFLLKMH